MKSQVRRARKELKKLAREAEILHMHQIQEKQREKAPRKTTGTSGCQKRRRRKVL